jgi:mxaC protein
MMAFDQALWLVALPLALLPLWRGMRQSARVHPWLALVPRDPASTAIDIAMRTAAALAIAGCVTALAGPHEREQTVERVGRGAEIVIVLDRSRSMDESFTRKRDGGGFRESAGASESKAGAARRIVSRFVSQRVDDAFAVVLFSAQALPVLPFTQHQDVILAAIDASGIGRGLGNTDIGRAMLAGAANFDDRAYLGSRAILLISDGGAQLDPDMRTRLADTLRRHRIGLYWIYLRGANGRKLRIDRPAEGSSLAGSSSAASSQSAGAALATAVTDEMPEQSLHDYFASLGMPYRVYEAEKPEAVQGAIDDLGRVEQHPIVYSEILPRRDLLPLAVGIALAALLLLLGARWLLGRRWA